jgi:hypothetical protein
MLVKHIRILFDVTLELGLLFLTALALGACNLALHMLDLEVGVVNQLLLPLLFDLKLADVSLQVATGRQSTTNVTNEVGLLSAQLEQLLGFLEQLLLLRSDFLFDLHHHSFRLLEFVRSMSIGLLESHLLLLLSAQAILCTSVSLFGSFEPLHLLFENFVDIGDI